MSEKMRLSVWWRAQRDKGIVIFDYDVRLRVGISIGTLCGYGVMYVCMGTYIRSSSFVVAFVHALFVFLSLPFDFYFLLLTRTDNDRARQFRRRQRCDTSW